MKDQPLNVYEYGFHYFSSLEKGEKFMYNSALANSINRNMKASSKDRKEIEDKKAKVE